MCIPRLRRRGIYIVLLENGGVVDETSKGTQGIGGTGNESGQNGGVGKVGL